MKSIINRLAIIFGAIIGVLTVLGFINQSEDGLPLNSSSNVVDIIGIWIQDDMLYHREAKKTDKLTGNLSDVYGEIKIIFNSDFTYNSYYDKEATNGKWKIENNSLDMNRREKENFTDWARFKYKLNNDELIIYSYPWLMALRKEIDN